MDLEIILGIIFPFLGTTLGASLVFFLKDKINDKLQKIFHQFCAENKIMHNNDEIFKFLATVPQEKIKSDFLEFDF